MKMNMKMKMKINKQGTTVVSKPGLLPSPPVAGTKNLVDRFV